MAKTLATTAQGVSGCRVQRTEKENSNYCSGFKAQGME